MEGDLNYDADDTLEDIIRSMRLDAQPRLIHTMCTIALVMKRWFSVQDPITGEWSGGLPADLATHVCKFWGLEVGLVIERTTKMPMTHYEFVDNFLRGSRAHLCRRGPLSGTVTVWPNAWPPLYLLPLTNMDRAIIRLNIKKFSLDYCESGDYYKGRHVWVQCFKCGGGRCSLCMLPCPTGIWPHCPSPDYACLCCRPATRRSNRRIARIRSLEMFPTM